MRLVYHGLDCLASNCASVYSTPPVASLARLARTDIINTDLHLAQTHYRLENSFALWASPAVQCESGALDRPEREHKLD